MNGRRLLYTALSAAALAAAALTPATAGADPAANANINVTLYRPEQAPTTDRTTIAALQQSCPETNESPLQYGSNGQPANAETPGAGGDWLLSTVLSQCLPTPIAVSSIDGVMIYGEQPNESPELLTQSDLQTPSPYLDDEQTPIIFFDGTYVCYERPQLTPSDGNYLDSVTVGGLDISVDTAPWLNVTLHASETKLAVGQSVTLTASVPKTVRRVTYSWELGGLPATPTSGPTVTTGPITTAFGYSVLVTATDAAGNVGSASVEVQVGPATPGKPGPGGGHHHHHHERSTTPGNGKGKSSSTHPGSRSGSGNGRGTGKGSSDDTGHGRHNGSGDRGSSGSHKRTRTSHAPTGAASPATGPVTAATTAGRRRVTGWLLDGVIDAEPADESPLALRTVHSPASPLTEPAGPGALAATLGAVAVVLLIGLGAGRELIRLRSVP